MRPLVHPAIADVTVESILHALSDPVRAAIYAELLVSAGATCSNFLKVSNRDIPKSTLSQHFRALREAGLIRSERQGVEMRNTARCAEVDGRFPGLVAAIMRAHQVQAQAKTLASSRNPRRPGKKSKPG